jgi:hypothetical protein
MVTIKCSVYEKRDLELVLKYAEDKYKEDCSKGKITEKYLKIELDKIRRLKQRVDGNVTEDYLQRSWSYNRNHGTLKKQPTDDLPKAPFIRTEW